MHHNSRSILKEGRIDEYDILLESIDNPFHIMAFSETWLKNDNAASVSFHDYDHVHIIRPLNGEVNDREQGGGLSFFIKNGITIMYVMIRVQYYHLLKHYLLKYPLTRKIM